MTRNVVMEGSLDEFDLMSVVQTVSIGRQFTGVELIDDTGSVVGTMCLKAGQLLSASSEGFSGIAALKRLFRTKRSSRFFVFRGPSGTDTRSPLGAIGDIFIGLLSNQDQTAETSARLLMEGSLREFSLEAIVQTVGLGRQCIGIDLFDKHGRSAGTLCVKAGQVVFAVLGQLTGRAAFHGLMGGLQAERFVAYRTAVAGNVDSLGSVHDLLKSAAVAPGAGHLQRAIPLDATHEQSTTDPSMAASAPEPVTALHGVAWRAPAKTPYARPSMADLPPTHAHVPPPTATDAVVAPPILSPPTQPPSVGIPLPPIAVQSEPPSQQPKFRSSRSPVLATPPAQLVSGRHERREATPHQGPAPIVCITSPKGGAGKTTIALNVAIALARRGKRVIVVDGDTNGLMPVVDCRREDALGVGEILACEAIPSACLLETRVAGLKLLPSGRPNTEASPADWARLLRDCQVQADLVLVDCPPGTYGPTLAIARASTHTLVVLPSEPAALRALDTHRAALHGLGEAAPQVLGIVLNLLDYQARVSIRVLEELCVGPHGRHTFDVPIPRAPAFMEATACCMPLAFADPGTAPTMAWVFEMLATSMLERLGLFSPQLAQQSFVL